MGPLKDKEYEALKVTHPHLIQDHYIKDTL